MAHKFTGAVGALVLGVLTSSAMAGTAMAGTFVVNTSDTVYGTYHGTVSSPGTFTWRTAGYFWAGNIDLTEGGNVIADITTANDDTYVLNTADSAIGAPCTATACVAVTDGQTVSLYSTINSVNGGSGICCDFNGITPQITVNPSVPEPATWSLMLTGFGLVGYAMRKSAKIRSSVTFA